eukprot:Lithocolla_globosa_v1_NODE_2952_length_1814_cov_4.807277.p2 type:complete len:151 gc:universal NODE_2952_length_1814_cov_4.807277:1279-1731(+)
MVPPSTRVLSPATVVISTSLSSSYVWMASGASSLSSLSALAFPLARLTASNSFDDFEKASEFCLSERAEASAAEVLLDGVRASPLALVGVLDKSAPEEDEALLSESSESGFHQGRTPPSFFLTECLTAFSAMPAKSCMATFVLAVVRMMA